MSNNFKNFLSNLVTSYTHIYGAVIMGFDGMTLSKYFNTDLPMSEEVFEALIGEFIPVVKGFHSKSTEMSLGNTKNITADTEKTTLLFKILNDNYFLAIVASKRAFVGKIDYLATQETKKFMELFNV